ncbi:hypothetical protein G7Y89_g15267 [Cudoniella acicularis]|uniref:Uncharacterized protein n=1 Tax=Cudoniella acicularis TaxID=354080 RepID=A0A8H4VPL9_9HELO|nr:hypothetical protein G7Y89_g15267 [Cudoniella acicularis]
MAEDPSPETLQDLFRQIEEGQDGLAVYTRIPSRVTTPFALQVRTSSIPNAGRGLFTLEAIPAGSLIFSIKETLLTVPLEPLLGRTTRLLKVVETEGVESHCGDIDIAITAVKNTGLGVGIWPNHPLYLLRYFGCMPSSDLAGMLKAMLKIYFDIEPALRPKINPFHRWVSFKILPTNYYMLPPNNYRNSPFPVETHRLFTIIYYHLRGKMVRKTEELSGVDSTVAEFERVSYFEYFGQLKEMQKGVKGIVDGYEMEYTPLKENEELQRGFVTNLNTVLEWAGVEAKMAEELI